MLEDPTLLLLHEEVGESYDAVAFSAARAVGAEACHLALYDAETDELIARRPHYEAPGRPVPRYRFSLESSPASCRVVRSGQPYFTNDPANDPLYSPMVGGSGLHSVLTVPVQRVGRLLGLVYALNKPGGFSAEDAETLLALAGAFAVTLENIHLYGRERERRLLHESLSTLSRVLVEALPETTDLDVVLEQMARVVAFQAASALVREGDELRVSASRGGRVGLRLPWPGPEGLAAVVSGGPLCVLTDAPATLAAIGIHAEGTAALAAPLRSKHGVLGALVVAFEPGHPVLERDRQLVAAFADHTAAFLEAGAALRREREAGERAAMLSRLIRLAATTMEAESFLMSSASEILTAGRADRIVLYLRHPRSNELVPVAHAGVTSSEVLRVWELKFDLRAEALRPLAERRQSLVMEDLAAEGDPRLAAPFPETRALALIPMMFREEVIGALLACRVGRGRPRPFDASLRGFLTDVAQQVALGVGNARLFATLSQMAATDDLTQLANRRKFSEALRVELARSRRSGVALALILADIDHLKQVNDAHGHPAGDAAIRHVAEALQRGRRETDLAARLGGEEFALLLPATDRTGAVRAAERIRADLAGTPVPVVGRVTVSLGVAIFPEDGNDERELVARADERLYAAKSAGRNRVVV